MDREGSCDKRKIEGAPLFMLSTSFYDVVRGTSVSYKIFNTNTSEYHGTLQDITKCCEVYTVVLTKYHEH